MSTESTVENDDNENLHAQADEAEARDESDRDERDAKSNGASSNAEVVSAEKSVIERPSSAKVIRIIAGREIAAYFNSAITYVVVAASFVILGLWFFFYKGGFWQVDRATMQRAFDAVPAALCAVIPLFTMRSLSDEKRVGTIELLITMPVKDSEVILGKFLGSLSVITVQLALLAIYPIAMFKWPWHIGELDWNPFWVGMMGLFFLSAAGTAIGLMWSSYTESQILSYFAATLTMVILYGIGSVTLVEFMNTSGGWAWLGDSISFISLQSRFEPFSRGIIDTRAIIYFLSLTVLCLMVAFRSLESRKWT